MSLTVIYGPMFAGKTTTLLTYIYNNNKPIYVINSILDIRTTNYIKTHNGIKYIAHKHQHINFTNLELQILRNNYDIIILDEAQFFNNLLNNINNMLSYNFTIYVAGLDLDSNQNKFGEILDLIPIANNIIQLTGKCYICSEIAPYTKRLDNINTSQILIGNNDKYACSCKLHL